MTGNIIAYRKNPNPRMGHQLDPVAEQKRLPLPAQSLINIEKLIAFHRL